jgi:hypothetical protein
MPVIELPDQIPTSPERVVAPVLVTLEKPRTEKLAAAPRDGAVAASAAIGPTRPNARETTTAVTIKFLLNLFICFI